MRNVNYGNLHRKLYEPRNLYIMISFLYVPCYCSKQGAFPTEQLKWVTRQLFRDPHWCYNQQPTRFRIYLLAGLFIVCVCFQLLQLIEKINLCNLLRNEFLLFHQLYCFNIPTAGIYFQIHSPVSLSLLDIRIQLPDCHK